MKAPGREHAVMRQAAIGATALVAVAAFGGGAVLESHVFTQGDAGLAVGSARYQSSVSVGQFSIAGQPVMNGDVVLASGYQATTRSFDTDGDGTPDTADSDSDSDGTADATDPRPYDTDGDGQNNLADNDDDNDGLPDSEESAFGTSWVNANTDGDKQTDYEEWVAGTDGTDPGSFFEIENIDDRGPTAVGVVWAGVAGRQYTLTVTNRLDASGAWPSVGSTGVTANGTVTFVSEPVSGKAYYKLQVSRP
jgi:hypothetical protein